MPSDGAGFRRDVSSTGGQALARVGGWNAELDRAGDRNWWVRILKAYGEDSLRLVSDITFFHFRANWRTEDMVVAPDCEPVGGNCTPVRAG